MITVLHHIVHQSQGEALREMKKHRDILTDRLTLDCASQVNHCACSANLEYFRKPDHVLQCLQKGKCFHCQRYRAMHREHDTVTASTSLLLVAAARGNMEILKHLHLNGASLESKTGEFELRPLHLAISNGHFHVFCYLLAHKVNVNAVARSQGTELSPLMMAVIHKREDMVRHLLLTKGINLQYRNSLSQTAVLFAVRNNSHELVELLLDSEMAVLDRTLDASRLRKLHHPYAMLEAVKQGNASLLEKLLENRTKVNFVYRGYYVQTTATTLAVVANSHRCLKLLVEHGADDDFYEIEEITALGWARRLKWPESLDALREAKFDVCSAHDAVGEPIGKEGDVTSPSLPICSPNVGLSSAETDYDAECDNECSCICDAREAFLTECENFEVSNDSPHPLIEIWSLVQWLDVSDAIRRLVIVGYDVNFQDELGRTSLHMAIEEQNVPGLRALLELGADPNLQDACSATPFWHAVFWDKVSMIKELLFTNAAQTACLAKEDAYRIGLPWASNDPSLEHDEIVFSEKRLSTLEVAVRKNFCYTVQLLLETGYDMRTADIRELSGQSWVKSDMREILQNHIAEPQSLFKQSRNFIRRNTGVKIHRLVREADLPRRINDCLLLRDHIDLKLEPDYSNFS